MEQGRSIGDAALFTAPPVSRRLSSDLRSPSRLAVFKHDM